MKKRLSKEFESNDLGYLRYFLEIEMAISNQGIFLSQRKQVIKTHIEVNHRLKKNDNTRLIDVGRYQRLVGCLINLSLTRPDITYVGSIICQFMNAPTQDHLEVTYRVLKYLKGYSGKGILYRSYGHSWVEIYADVDWVGLLTDSRSTSSYCSFVGEI